MISVIEIIRGDEFQRKVWVFEVGANGLEVRLFRYAEQSRLTKRHNFKGPEWNYNQRDRDRDCLDKPKDIPHDVLNEAVDELKRLASTPAVYIGYRNYDDIYFPATHASKQMVK